MLSRFDRLLLVVAQRPPVVDAFRRLLDAEQVAEDRVAVLAAQRSVLRLGRSEVELLEPDGPGVTARFLKEGGGLFAVGFAAPDPRRLREHLADRGVACDEEGGQLYLSSEALGTPGLRVVVGAEASREPAGLLRFLYETTHLAPDWRSSAEAFAATFDLDAEHFTSIQSAEYGYEGTLTLLGDETLDRVEIVTPRDPEKTMGRFMKKRGPCLYMAYAESDQTQTVRERLREHAPHHWTGPGDAAVPDNLFIHPQALGGLLLGVSRTSFAWSWSGRPERVRPVGAA